MFNFIKDKFNKIYTQFTSKINSLFSKKTIDKNTILEIENLLISADMGNNITKQIIKKLNDEFEKGNIKEGQDLKKIIEEYLINILNTNSIEINNVILLVGINGSGKTTFAGKLTNLYNKLGKKVLLVAADTFRAAATEQLKKWAEKTQTAIEIGKDNQDPAAVVFSGCQRFKDENFDILIIDTAGRLQTKIHLMKELEKIKKIIQRQLPQEKVSTILTIDSMLGQNSLEQAKVFNESTNVDSLVLTKMDGTGKAGVAFAIVQELKIPISYICFGEEIEKIKKFDAAEYTNQLLS